MSVGKFDNNRSKQYSSLLVYSKIVSCGKAGGRKFVFVSFSVSGNKKNRVGMAYGDSNQPGISIRKSINNSVKKTEYFYFGGSTTMAFEAEGKYKSSIVILKPCSKFNGLKAGGVVRKTVSLLGIENVTSKVIGSKHPRNVAFATFEALREINEYGKILNNRKNLNSENNKNNPVFLNDLKDRKENSKQSEQRKI